MRFGQPWWLAGTAVALLVAAFFVLSGVFLVRSVRRFGDEGQVRSLITDHPGGRRALKGVLAVLAVALAFVALAQPQYGRGTRLVPATNLDVVIVLDYSKSMFARDVPPSRIERAKTEVARMIAELPGARFGAVAFAGEPVSFPLTSDGSAIAQFFRQLSPNDMPVGGTAIARALEAGRQLLARDPLSKRHKRVLILVTDGEDLEGDPVAVAKSAGQDGIAVHVVQIGGRTPEPIPDVNEAGEVVGYRRDSQGRPLTTSLSAAGEQELTEMAQATGGSIVRSERGSTGITEVTRALGRSMTEELSERVETVYADVYVYPAALAALLLFLETFIGETARRKRRRGAPHDAAQAATALLVLSLFGCADRKVPDPFVRYSPEVDQAIRALDAGATDAAVGRLSRYLNTGPCKQGEIGTPEAVRSRPNASFDLGLAFFEVGEHFGARFGEEPPDLGAAAPGGAPQVTPERIAMVDCALRIVQLVATDGSAPLRLRARAHYLAGNLEFLRMEYENAIAAYDAALKLVPGLPEGQGDPLGRDAAYNRALALRRKKEQEDRQKPPDAGTPDAQPSSDGGAPGDGGQQQSPDGGDDSQPDAGKPSDDSQQDDEPDQDQDQQKDDPPQDDSQQEQQPRPPEEQQAEQQPSTPLSQDERMLDSLEQAPTLQQEAARIRSQRSRVIGEDK